jgi:hypothetical protein
MESSALFVSLFSSWQIIAVCLLLMFLLPLVFFVASTKSRKKSMTRAPKKRPARAKPRQPVPQAAAESGEGPESRDRAEPSE